MNPERYQRVKELFELAGAVEPDQQAAYLQSACGDDAELFREVSSLLEASTTVSAIVDKPAAAYLDADLLGEPAQSWIGKHIGPYQITALLGQGGMGSVYRARRVDAEFEKQVAVKLVPGGNQAQFVLQRLRSERQILATLDHPGIARLIDGGATEEGTPYLIMELVEGEPIDRYCESHDLTLRERLVLFRQVCVAVGYAHQHLVVHRDIKPSNILVTADGAVKLLDFGIAKLLQPLDADSKTSPTVTQMRAMTPGFSSPEQILGRPITTASDVYSLGVLLYLLLTGRSPYRGKLTSTQDAIREIVETEPTRPHLVHDLEAVLLRALRKEPERRYATVERFSDDIRRYLEGLPVIAHGDQFSYRAGKFLRRHKLTLAAGSLVLIALLGATVISIRQAHIAKQERARAEQHFASVRKLADVFMFQMHDAIKDLQGATEARSLLVKTALEYLNTLSKEAGKDRDLLLDLARAYEKVADIQGEFASANTGESRAAVDSYRKAIELLETLAAGDPGNKTLKLALGETYVAFAKAQLYLGDGENAKAAAQKSVEMAQALAKLEDTKQTQVLLGNALLARALIFGQMGDYPISIASSQEATQLIAARLVDDPTDIEGMQQLSNAYSLGGLVFLAANPGRAGLERAIEDSHRSLELSRKVVEITGGKNPRHLRSLLADYVNLCGQNNSLGRYAEALTYCRSAAPLSDQLATDESNIQAQIDRGSFRWNLGNTLRFAGEYAEAEAVLRNSIEAMQQIEKKSDTLVVQYVLGSSEQAMGGLAARQAQRKDISREAQIRHWRAALDWYERAMPRLELVQKSMALDSSDVKPVNEAKSGLANARAALAAARSP